MTRFARAKGSKASNERVLEQATPWKIMKEEMRKKQQEISESKGREKQNKIRLENYDNFLKEQTSDIKTEWAEFPEEKSSNTLEKKKKSITKKQKKNQLSKNTEDNMMMSKEDIMDMLKPDKEIDKKLEKLTAKIAKVLDEEKLKNNKTHITVKEKDMDNTLEIKSDSKLKRKKITDTLINDVSPITKKRKLEKNVTSENKNSFEKSKRNKFKEDSLKQNTDLQKKDENILTKTMKRHKVKKHEANDTENAEYENKIIRKQTEVFQKGTVIQNTDSQEKIEKILTKSMKKRLKKKEKLKASNPNSENNKVQTKNLNKPNKNQRRKNKLKVNKNEDIDEKNIKNNNEEIEENNDIASNNKYKKPNKFPRKQEKLKVAKVRDNLEHKRRKPIDDSNKSSITVNGVEIKIVRFQGYPIKKEDQERLIELRKQMIIKGIPRSEVEHNLKLERRRAEKALARIKNTICFHCRKTGHLLSDCPELNSGQISVTGTGICFKCGSTEHTHTECKVTKTDDYKFASCFICREQGHIARQCPDNPKGLYPQGGACKLCGDVTHFKKDCPQHMKEKEDKMIHLSTISGKNIEDIDDDVSKPQIKPMPLKNKVIKF